MYLKVKGLGLGLRSLELRRKFYRFLYRGFYAV